MERAERDAENRGIRIERGNSEDVGNRKRKRGTGAGIPDAAGGGLEKGEAALLRRAADAGVTVIKAPKGMSRRKGNSSRWFSKYVSCLQVSCGNADCGRQKCLNWSVEWILPNHKKVARNCVESSTLADAYDRVSPPPRDESTGHVRVQVHEQVPGHGQESTQVEFENIQEDSMSPSQQLDSSKQLGSNQSASEEITPHRDVYFYLHRPRTATKQPVLIPLVPNMTFTTALRGRTVLEFPTIYVLPDSPRGLLTEKSHLFLLEEEYLRTVEPGEEPGEEAGKVPAANARGAGDSSIDVVDLGQVDEQKVLDVLKQDISGTGRA